MTGSHEPDSFVEDRLGKAPQRLAYPGAIAGAILRSARLSAAISETELAASTGVGDVTLRSWEAGTQPLASVVAPQLERLEAALRSAGAKPQLVADLPVAAWCDLVVLAIAASEDLDYLLADPLASQDAFYELLTWSVSDQPPVRYRPYASSRRLLAHADPGLVTQVVEITSLLQPTTENLAQKQGNDVL